MVPICSMFAVFAVSHDVNTSPFPVRFDMLDGSWSLYPQPKPQRHLCLDKWQVCKVPRDGGRIKALFKVDSTLLVGAAAMF